jgi:hypothetical protein
MPRQAAATSPPDAPLRRHRPLTTDGLLDFDVNDEFESWSVRRGVVHRTAVCERADPQVRDAGRTLVASHANTRKRDALHLRQRRCCLAHSDDIERWDRALDAGESHLGDRIDVNVILNLSVKALLDQDLPARRFVGEP